MKNSILEIHEINKKKKELKKKKEILYARDGF